ncbi:hypothetical protein Y1Q_0012708 [Alligator mississippiensis]|uniref:Uncharacterized protein n=1 Tax=Alligator mississippiensis TaxID=8496 RepID=A0A151M8M6_ALLMI|nr:hypothetical protein Y1Q_0012708 [Alligator mississippiensis]
MEVNGDFGNKQLKKTFPKAGLHQPFPMGILLAGSQLGASAVTIHTVPPPAHVYLCFGESGVNLCSWFIQACEGTE